MSREQIDNKTTDCVVVGSCCVDVLIGPLELDQKLPLGKFAYVDPMKAVTGGIVPNSGIAMARLGLRVTALAGVGHDEWADVVHSALRVEGVNSEALVAIAETPTSSTAILVDRSGEHFIAHYPGADQCLDRAMILDNLDLFRRSRMALFGYYGILDELMADLPEVLAEIRRTGCQTALDAAGDGGSLQPLDRILPHLDLYVPSLAEGMAQTGESEPQRILECYRSAGATGLLGVKLGADGALLSAADGKYDRVAAVDPPGSVVETIGAGDSFYAGLITGLLRGLSVTAAGRLASAAGACCVTQVGASAGIRDFEQTARLAGLS